MTISRGQMNRQLYENGGIMSLSKEGIGGGDYKGIDMGSRTGFGILKKITGGAKKLVKGATKAVSKIASSDVGKAALIGAAAFGIPGTSIGGLLGRASFGGAAPGIFGLGGVSNLFSGASTIGNLGNLAKGKNALSLGKSASGFGTVAKLAGLAGISTFLTGTMGMSEEQAEEELARDPSKYLELYYRNLNPPTADTNSEEYEAQVREFVETNTSEYTAGQGAYAEGGRIGFDNGSPRFDIDDIDFGSMQDIMPELELKDDKSIPMPELDLEEDILVPGPDGKIKVKPIPMPGSDGKPLAGIEKLQASVQYELPFGEPLFVVKQAGRLFGVFEQKDGSRILLPMDKSGSRLNLADAGPVLPNDPTQPVNPFGPRPPADAPVLPDRMASNMENDKILEALFEKYLDMGLSPEKAAQKAREEFERMSMMKTEGRGLAALGGRMNYALGDTASQNAMQAASVEGLPVRQNPKGVQELDLRDNGGFIPPVGIKEKEDDIPAMLSNNEFVFTADAVRGMGDGNVNVGAQRMYDMMKKLEAGGSV